jgi:hypothetical protein
LTPSVAPNQIQSPDVKHGESIAYCSAGISRVEGSQGPFRRGLTREPIRQLTAIAALAVPAERPGEVRT